MLNKMWKILFLLFLISCADDTTVNSTTEINPENLNIMTWNIKNFPQEDELTIGFVAEIINSLDVDIIALQEITSTSALTELTNNLNGNWISDRYGSSNWGELSYLINIDKIEIIVSVMNIRIFLRFGLKETLEKIKGEIHGLRK